MDYRSAYLRQSRKSNRLKRRVAAACLFGMAGCAALFALAVRGPAPASPAVQVQAPGHAATALSAALRGAEQAETNRTRRVYRYSIVPGGVLNRQELGHAVIDKVVAEHYAAFETAKATIKTVGKPRAVYVSYRKGDKVYWTAKKLHLAEGETLLSDGRNEIRTRCGNRISDVPQLPVEAHGPSEEELDASVEQVQQDDGEGKVEHVAFAAEENPAGQGYQLQTFASGGAQDGGTSPAHNSSTLTGLPGSGPGVIWDGGVPVLLAGNESNGTTGTGTGGGGSDTGGGGSDIGGTTPSGGSGTKPSSTIPDTLLPTTDQPGTPDGTGKTPAKHGDVPEPGTLWLGGVGMAALLAARRATRRANKRPRG
jgi:hypothetical protein